MAPDPALNPRISLDQWRALVAVVEAGGYAQAAAQLHKTQSSVSYLVQKIERLLDLKLFQIDGRKARLTAHGEVLYRRARALVDEAEGVERAAQTLAAGWEPELRIAADIVFPTWILLRAFARFGAQRPQTRIQLYETVLGGTDEALLERRVHIGINTSVPAGFVGDALLTMRFIAAAHPDHPLHRLGRPLTHRDLRIHRHLVIRDSGVSMTRQGGGWFGSEQRWTFTAKATSIFAAGMGLGFAWFPEETIRGDLERGVLKPLPLREGAERHATVYLILAEGDAAGPATRLLTDILREEVRETCAAEKAALQRPPAEAPQSARSGARARRPVRRS
jgi:DNA-binding transcriptional LysR family regulator